MQAIQTKYLGPTNYRPASVVAQAEAGRLVVSWDHGLGIAENHAAAAKALADKLGWNWELATGALPDGSYAHVFVAHAAAP